MPSLVLGAQAGLVLLACAGFYTTAYMLLHNGTTDHLKALRGVEPHVLPGTTAPLRRTYTGIEAVDARLAVLGSLFWVVVDGSAPNASLHGFMFAGQMAAAWGLLVLEGARRGNKGRLISYVVVWGILVQNVAYAVILPLYFVLFLSTSPTLSPNLSNVLATPDEVFSVPVSIILGFIVPSIAATLPAPSVLSFDNKQIIMAIWQAFPLWVAFVQLISKSLIGLLFPESRHRQGLLSHRFLYGVLFFISGATHIAAAAVSAFSSLFPALFAPEYKGVLDYSNVYVPAAITPATKMPSIVSGMFLLLQWDEIVGGAALLLWAVVLYVMAARDVYQNSLDWLLFLVVTGTLTFIAGPSGTAIALLWARDEHVNGGAPSVKKSN